MRGRNWNPRWLAILVVVSATLAGWVEPAHADPRTDYLIRVLSTSQEFRVRTQAALSLGRVTAAPDVLQALTRALSDEHPAVRAAAASSLGAIGDGSVLTALRRAVDDRDPAVRQAAQGAVRSVESRTRAPSNNNATSGGTNPPEGGGQRGNARFYVGVGLPGTRAQGVAPATLRSARDVLVREVGSIDGVEVAPESETNSQATSVIRQRALVGYFLDASIVSVESNPTGTRVVVSVVVATYPGRDMRAILQGSATVPGETGPAAVDAALEGALQGALRRLPQALAAGAATAGR